MREIVQQHDHSAEPPDLPVTDARTLSGARVLISDENYKHSLAIVRHLGKQGAHVSVVAASKNSLVCHSRYCRKIIPSNGPSPESLIERLLESARREHFDLVIPVSYPMTLALARRHNDFRAVTHLELVESEAIELAADKTAMMSLAAKIGVPSPKTIAASEVEDRASDLTFPVVVKPQRETPGRSPIRYARTLPELRNILTNESSRTDHRHSALIVQEFIPGVGCGFFATYQHGICKRVFMHRRVREYPAAGGVSSCAESFYDPVLEGYGRCMLEALEWHGIAMVEFRRDSRDRKYKLMEINPKFWGSLDLALEAGADFPGDLCRMALGHTLPFTADYRRPLRFQWPFSGHGDLFHLWTRPQSVFQVGLDFLNPRVKSNVWLSDFKPNAHELLRLGGQLVRAGKK